MISVPDHADSADSTAGSGSHSLRWTSFSWLFCWPDAGSFICALYDRRWRGCGRCRRRRSGCGRYRRWSNRGRPAFGRRDGRRTLFQGTAERILLCGSANRRLLGRSANSGLRESRVGEGASTYAK